MTVQMKRKKRDLKPIDAQAPSVRKMDFEGLDQLSNYYIAGNSFVTHTVNAYHIIFPEGERFFIKSVKAFADKVQDPKLQNNIKAFIGQEVQHGKEHEKALEMLEKKGYPVAKILKFYVKTAYELFWPILEFLFGKKLKLSVTAGLEHYTATMGEISLRHNLHDQAEGEMRNLLLWHACEEIEHKSVAYDVLQTVSKSYLLRVFGFIVATFMFWGYAIIIQHLFIFSDPGIGFKRYFADMKNAGPYAGLLWKDISKAFLLYFKRDFHPDQTGGYELANAALATI
ncbi:putative metal-dependent hydrolase [Leptospira broomii serovar Hurstbridge str. 5399]|uniref:Metal-dependent hydrolase n=1 Tax=Leptospira broomii serovar Hurstbridge str. 5399 TaxID=1049789 RepID=T0EYD3_9LEPT|nr:metal-dependent hydrolase [Leptospira broomii]EQA43860.1 putative metal-dependent hydrolase [Leptospira broomii serovar Hurstbridge str. 5399]